VSAGYRSNNFIVGLTNDNRTAHAPILWKYALCGQYPGPVKDGATVSIECTNSHERGMKFRYVVIQFPLVNDHMNICEIEVFAYGMLPVRKVTSVTIVHTF